MYTFRASVAIQLPRAMTGQEIIEVVRRLTGVNFVEAVNPDFPELRLVGQATEAASGHIVVRPHESVNGLDPEQRYKELDFLTQQWENTAARLTVDFELDSTRSLRDLVQHFIHAICQAPAR